MAQKCLGTIRKFTETGALPDKELILVRKEDVDSVDMRIDDDPDYTLETKFAFVQRNMRGDLVTVALSDPDEELPSELDDCSWEDLELYEVVRRSEDSSVPTYRELAAWLLEGEHRVLLNRDDMVLHVLNYKLSDADRPANDIRRYNEDFSDDDGWDDIKNLSTDDENGYWKISN